MLNWLVGIRRTRTSFSTAVMASAPSATAPVPWKRRGAASSHPLGLESRAIFSQQLVRNEAMKADFVSALEQREEGEASRSNRKAVEAIRAKMNMNVSLGPVERLDEVAPADLWAKLLLAANRKGSKLLAKFRAMLHVFDSWARLFYSAAAPSLFVMPDSGEWQPVDALTLSAFVHAVGQGAIVKGGYFVGDYKPPVSCGR